MKRKIAAIMAADIAGYSKLVAEDEEETLRRLESYRAVFQDFVTRASGRVFNTSGDAVLAEFPSAVEAVRCAIDVQESLRTRNLGYPASRQMSFRIGITIGDVVERDGDLLGDGVNVAARLEGLAQPGGLCVSRTVYEQVANKLSVDFVDIGEQEVKNLPMRIHAYALALGTAERRAQAAASNRPKYGQSAIWPVAITAASAAAIAVTAFLYFGELPRTAPGATGAPVASVTNAEPMMAAAPATAAKPVALEPASAPLVIPRPVGARNEPLVPEMVPFIPDRQRVAIRNAYLSAPDHKAIAISHFQSGFSTDQKDDNTAAVAAITACQRATEVTVAASRCDLYAVGNTLVSGIGRLPMPPEPWVVRDPSIETPFDADLAPLVNDGIRANLQKSYRNGRSPKAVAISALGQGGIFMRQSSSEEAVRRALELCASRARVACMILAVDDTFVVPIPTTMKAVGLFHGAHNESIAPDARDDVVNRLGNARSGWNAVAVGAGGRPGLTLKASTEQQAVDGALAECGRQDRGCRVIAIGPFAVEAK
jgi:class 3 adenylate cyclase